MYVIDTTIKKKLYNDNMVNLSLFVMHSLKLIYQQPKLAQTEDKSLILTPAEERWRSGEVNIAWPYHNGLLQRGAFLTFPLPNLT